MLSSTPAPPATLLRFLVRWKTPPEKGARLDGPVRSFVANKQLLLDALRAARTSMHSVAYHATSIALTAGSEVDELTVTNIRDPNTIPSREDPPPAANTATGAVIIPHRGPAGLLSTCLHYITRQPSPKPNVTVAFDEPLRPQLNALMRRYPQAAFYKSEPVHAGPYPARQQLAVQSTEEFLFFQDSDDASCTNRLSRLAAELTATHSDMLGSHELRFNEIRGTLSIRRFPLNVREALARAPSSALLFPSTCVRRQAFLASGGLSTASRFGTDTQFILRSYFSMESIRNVDEILYIRRIRNGSLTTAPATGLENPVRTARRKAWQQDFHRAMFSNSIDRDSTLRPQHRKSPIKLTRLDTEVGSIRPRRISKRE